MLTVMKSWLLPSSEGLEAEDRHIVDMIVARGIGEVRGARGRHSDIIVARSQGAGQKRVARSGDALGHQSKVAVAGAPVIIEIDIHAACRARPADRPHGRGIVLDEPDPVDLDHLVFLEQGIEPQGIDEAAPGVRARVQPERGNIDDIDEPVVVDVKDAGDGTPVVNGVFRPEELPRFSGRARAQVHSEREPRVLGGVDREVFPGFAQHRGIEVGRVQDGDVDVGIIGRPSGRVDRLGRKDAVLEGDVCEIGLRHLDGVEDPPAEVGSLVHVPAVEQDLVRVV